MLLTENQLFGSLSGSDLQAIQFFAERFASVLRGPEKLSPGVIPVEI